MRLSTSRPNGSVPSGKAVDGACIRAMIATTISPRMTTALTAPSGFCRTSRHPLAHTRPTEKPGAAREVNVSAVTDSRIEPGIAQIDEQVGDDDDGSEEQHRTLDQGVVAEQDGVEHQAAD